MDNKRAFVVENDLQHQVLLASALGRLGYDVTSFATGEAAVAEMKRRMPDLVVSDFRLPGTDGIHVLFIAKQLDPSVGRILVTADPNLISPGAAFSYDVAQVVIEKPFSVDGVGRGLEALANGERNVVVRYGD